ncbi:MAG: hypothetical protein K6E40_13780, partial [Desulfovibrio sp.]|nr:hypothetical protein [Desulfovibrio sp.]
GRTASAVRSRARMLGVKSSVCRRWTNGEVALLKSVLQAGSLSEAARAIGRSLPAVRAKALTLGLHPVRRSAWTAEQQALLVDGYRCGVPVAETAAAIGRTQAACRMMASRLGVRMCREKEPAGPVDGDVPAELLMRQVPCGAGAVEGGR